MRAFFPFIYQFDASLPSDSSWPWPCRPSTCIRAHRDKLAATFMPMLPAAAVGRQHPHLQMVRQNGWPFIFLIPFPTPLGAVPQRACQSPPLVALSDHFHAQQTNSQLAGMSQQLAPVAAVVPFSAGMPEFLRPSQSSGGSLNMAMLEFGAENPNGNGKIAMERPIR